MEGCELSPDAVKELEDIIYKSDQKQIDLEIEREVILRSEERVKKLVREAERKAKREAERKAKFEAELEAERKAKFEAERKALDIAKKLKSVLSDEEVAGFTGLTLDVVKDL